MNKTLISCLAVSFASAAFVLVLPVQADSSPGSTTAALQSATPTAATKSSSGLAGIPKKALGFIVGAAVGTPVSLFRRIGAENKEGIKGMVGDTDNKFQQVTAGGFWMPFSLLLGACEAPIYGPLNSLSNINKPFSKEQMGLGDHLMWAKDSSNANASSIPGASTPPAGSTPPANSAAGNGEAGVDTSNMR
jgi:hypothetical protein